MYSAWISKRPQHRVPLAKHASKRMECCCTEPVAPGDLTNWEEFRDAASVSFAVVKLLGTKIERCRSVAAIVLQRENEIELSKLLPLVWKWKESCAAYKLKNKWKESWAAARLKHWKTKQRDHKLLLETKQRKHQLDLFDKINKNKSNYNWHEIGITTLIDYVEYIWPKTS